MVYLLWAILLVLVGMAFPLLWPLIILVLILVAFSAFVKSLVDDIKSERTKEQYRLFKQQTANDLTGIAGWWNDFCELGRVCKRRDDED